MGEKTPVLTKLKREYDYANWQLSANDRPSEEVVRMIGYANRSCQGSPWELHSWAVVDGFVEVVLVREVPA